MNVKMTFKFTSQTVCGKRTVRKEQRGSIVTDTLGNRIVDTNRYIKRIDLLY
jgi:hypothetical protein